jgi:hypothetical protein
LHFSYSRPVRVSDAEFTLFVVERTETLRLVVVIGRDGIRVATFFVVAAFDFVGIKTVTGFADRADTVVFNGVRDETVLVARTAVVFVAAARARLLVFVPRTALSAPIVQNKAAQIKSKIFFISEIMLANL